MNIPFSQAKGLIKEADVLLFRAKGFLGVGWWISKYTASLYSHAALAYWDSQQLYALEFKEFCGGRQYPMDKYVTELDGRYIDVFRPVDTIIKPYIETVDEKPCVAYKELKFDTEIAQNITQDALDIIEDIGKYSYWTIWQMFKTYIPFIRLGRKVTKNGNQPDPKKFVCSTLVTYLYRTHFIDPVPFLPDNMTSPGDLSRSGLFSHLFSINC